MVVMVVMMMSVVLVLMIFLVIVIIIVVMVMFMFIVVIVIIVVVMMVGAGLAFLLFGGLAFKLAHPARGDGNMLVIKGMGIYNTVKINLCIIGFDDDSTGVKVGDNLTQMHNLVFAHLIHLVE
jgi:hypothetical protein